MPTTFSHKGAIRTILDPISRDRSRDPTPLLYELIDNRDHSGSKRVCISIDTSKRNLFCLYSEPASEEKMKSTTCWFLTNETSTANRISTRGIGSKLTSGFMLSDIYFLNKTKDDTPKYYRSSINATELWEADRNNVNDTEYDKKLEENTKHMETFGDDDLKKWEEGIFNEYKWCHFLCRHSNIQNKFFIDHVCNEESLMAIVTKMRTKYFHQVKSRDLELELKIDNKVYNIDTDGRYDTIGFTSEENSDVLNIDLFIHDKVHLGVVFRIEGMFFQFKKNGTSILKDNFVPDKDDNFTESDYTATIYQVKKPNFVEKNRDVYKNSMEYHTGWYIMIDNTFISDKPILWGVTDKRNLKGASRFRGVLRTNTPKGKMELGLEGLKDTFDARHKTKLNRILTQFSKSIYEGFCKSNDKSDPSTYVLSKRTKVTSTTSTNERRNISQWIYLIDFGEIDNNSGNHLCKFGKSKNPTTRIQSYGETKVSDKRRSDFSTKGNDYHLRYLSPGALKNGHYIEQKIKEAVNDDEKITTYDRETGNDILEYISGNPDYIYNKIRSIVHSIRNP